MMYVEFFLIFIIVVLAVYICARIFSCDRARQLIDILNIDGCDLLGANDRERFKELAWECYKREVRLAKWRFLRYLKNGGMAEQLVQRAEKILMNDNCSWVVLRSRRLKFKNNFIRCETKSGVLTISAPREKCFGLRDWDVDETIDFKDVPPKFLDDFWNLRYENIFPGEY